MSILKHIANAADVPAVSITEMTKMETIVPVAKQTRFVERLVESIMTATAPDGSSPDIRSTRDTQAMKLRIDLAKLESLYVSDIKTICDRAGIHI